jgi:hypothetical protein
VDNYDNKTLEQLWQHCLTKRVAHKGRPLTPAENNEARCFFLAGLIMAKGIARDSQAFYLNQFREELTAKIEGQLEVDRLRECGMLPT